jgi:ribosomal-protein-alanine N-acetyltransferase
MKEMPTLQTQRLVLRPMVLTDAPDIQRLAGDRDIASTTLRIPYPYEDGMAEEWIRSRQAVFDAGEGVAFAIVGRSDASYIGGIGLVLSPPHANAEMGYWIGKPYWNRGYGTEAAGGVLRYAFEQLGLNRVYAAHFRRNPASGRIMQKIGMTYEGCLRQHIKKWDTFEDMEYYGILRSEYLAGPAPLAVD